MGQKQIPTIWFPGARRQRPSRAGLGSAKLLGGCNRSYEDQTDGIRVDPRLDQE